MTAQILGWIATTLFTICYIPQMVKMYRSRSLNGLSFWLLFIQFIANIVAFCYATLIMQRPLQVKYVLALCMLAPCLVLYWRIRKS